MLNLEFFFFFCGLVVVVGEHTHRTPMGSLRRLLVRGWPFFVTISLRRRRCLLSHDSDSQLFVLSLCLV